MQPKLAHFNGEHIRHHDTGNFHSQKNESYAQVVMNLKRKRNRDADQWRAIGPSLIRSNPINVTGAILGNMAGKLDMEMPSSVVEYCRNRKWI